MSRIRNLILGIIAVLVSGCGTYPGGTGILIDSSPLAAPAACSGAFVRHDLPHTTMAGGNPITFFDSNGAGVALADLDDDGRIDIVLAGLHSPVTVLWNRGDLRFERDEIDTVGTRSVNAVDVDGDGKLDLVFTISDNLPSWWRGGRSDRLFTPVTDEEFAVWFILYSMAWSDLDGDGDVDMIGASYDGEISDLNNGMVVGNGIFYYENTDLGLESLRLGRESQCLAIAIADVNNDGRNDAIVGNDFALPDFVYYNREEGWKTGEPFSQTTQNTMSFARGDVDNDGTFELFATDMKPYNSGEDVDAAWRPLREATRDLQPDDGVQAMTNVLHVQKNDGTYSNVADTAGIDATGWSWSAQFGDLDNDGYLDLYVVNGMIAEEVFGHLPGAELVEENRALRNIGDRRFSLAPEWGLGDTESGRGMAMADLDLDGDLDIVVNNLNGPAVLFENQLCTGSSIEIDLRWFKTKNVRAIGSRIVLETSDGKMLREVKASSGYLSSDPSRIHFGFANDVQLHSLTVTWPDGVKTRTEQIQTNSLISITR